MRILVQESSATLVVWIWGRAVIESCRPVLSGVYLVVINNLWPEAAANPSSFAQGNVTGGRLPQPGIWRIRPEIETGTPKSKQSGKRKVKY
jgi:hypothetical protein